MYASQKYLMKSCPVRHFFPYELFVKGARLEFINGINLTYKIKYHHRIKYTDEDRKLRYAACRVSDAGPSSLSYARFADMSRLF